MKIIDPTKVTLDRPEWLCESITIPSEHVHEQHPDKDRYPNSCIKCGVFMP